MWFSLSLSSAIKDTACAFITIKVSRRSKYRTWGKSDRSWQGDKASKVTLEFEQGVPVKKQASFRSYQSIKDSVNDFVDFLNENPRYQEALNNTAEPAAFLDSLQKAGYATDPNYADKIKQVLKRVELQSVAASLVR